jgi:two-component system, NtrC family, sensor kinase
MSEHTVLLVDDEANILKSLRRLFLDTDYKVILATSGLEGLGYLEKEPIDLVISDYRMPEMTGVEFLSKVKAEHPDTVRMILSGFADVEAVVEAINQGEIYKFLAKPWNDQELLSTVKRALEHSSLQRENDKLLRELQSTNAELTKLAEDLESKVRERTRDLERKSRAVNIAHSILDLLPVGVIGMDSDDQIVYMNGTMHRYVDTSAIELGRHAADVLDPQVYAVMKETIRTGRPTTAQHQSAEGVGILSTPLARQSGAVALLGYLCVDHYNRHAEKTASTVETEAGANNG